MWPTLQEMSLLGFQPSVTHSRCCRLPFQILYYIPFSLLFPLSLAQSFHSPSVLQGELEKLNQSTDDINRCETELEVGLSETLSLAHTHARRDAYSTHAHTHLYLPQCLLTRDKTSNTLLSLPGLLY